MANATSSMSKEPEEKRDSLDKFGAGRDSLDEPLERQDSLEDDIDEEDRPGKLHRRHSVHGHLSQQVTAEDDDNDDDDDEDNRPGTRHRHSFHTIYHRSAPQPDTHRHNPHWNANSECGRHGDDWLTPKGVSLTTVVDWFRQVFVVKQHGDKKTATSSSSGKDVAAEHGRRATTGS